MQFLVSVIDSTEAIAAGRSELATRAEQDAIDVLNQELQDEGCWVFAGGLGMNDSATVIDNRRGETVITDGPFVESKEFLAGFWILELADLDAALRIATKASTACNRKIEVRPFLRPE
ncbi:MAG TPA: YciI family protein [Galbitalea sp.]|nr:YciI family protein [Galbitalea sp.]